MKKKVKSKRVVLYVRIPRALHERALTQMKKLGFKSKAKYITRVLEIILR